MNCIYFVCMYVCMYTRVCAREQQGVDGGGLVENGHWVGGHAGSISYMYNA